ncbi:MAG: hypothetical protein OEY85_12790 [Rhodospirillales bacterium]|nr:hypothetical protein [Rhodospirillales bacterium]
MTIVKLSNARKQSRRLEPQGPKVPGGTTVAGALTAPQFVRLLDSLMREQTEKEITEAVIHAQPWEVTNLAKKSAKLKGRYMAALLDMSKDVSLPAADQIRELKGLRERYEELDEGLALIKETVLGGALKLGGLKNDD